jgi:hypothetical protein
MSTNPPSQRGSSSPSFDESPLRQLAAGTRRWLRLAGIGRIIAWSFLAACAAIAIDLVLELSPTLRATLGGVIGLVALGFAIDSFWRRPRKVDLATATRQVESAHPEIGQMLRTAHDFSANPKSAASPLKGELNRRANIRLAGLDLTKNLPRRPAAKWLGIGAAVAVGFMIFLSANREAPTAFARLLSPFSGITFTKVKNSTSDPTFDRDRLPRIEAKVTGRPASPVTAFIVQPDGNELSFPMNPLGSGRFQVTLPASETSFAFRIEAGDSAPATGVMECVDPAKFVSSSAEITLPAYTGQPVTTQENADIEAVEGTTASLKFKMSAPMKQAALKLPNGELVPLTVDGDTLSTTLTVAIGGDLAELRGTDARGHEIEPTQFRHKGMEDALPVVEWIEPTKDIDATAVAELPLRVRLRDDFGVATYGIMLEARGESKEIMTRKIEARDLRDLSELTSAALESFPLTIRDNVRVYAWATDHKPREQTRAVSTLRGIDIRPFKRKWQMMNAPSGPPINPEDLVKVEKLIKTQRAILSDAFPILHVSKPSVESIKKLGASEMKLQQDASVLHIEVVAAGEWPADDLQLLQAAVSQMGESSTAWLAANVSPGFQSADAALSTLLELRKNLLTLLARANCPCLEPKPEEIPNKIAELAVEAERLAKEERDVKGQLDPMPDAERLAAIRRQQDIANSDTGELYSRLMDHPESTPMVLSKMADAEQQVREATRAANSSELTTSPPKLEAAAIKLEEVAKHLRALDEARMDETLAEMAAEAKKAAEAAKPKDPGEAPGEKSDGEKPAQAAGSKPGEGKTPSDKPSNAEGKNPGQGKGEGEGKGGAGMAANQPGQDPKDPAEARKDELAKAAAQAKTNDDILKFLSEKQPGTQEAERLKALREETATEKFEEKLKDVAAGKADGNKTAEELKSLAAALEKERDIRRQSRLNALAKNRELAGDLKKKAEARRDKPNGSPADTQAKNDGEGTGKGNGKGDKPGEGEGKGKGDKPGPNGKGEGAAPGNGPGQGQTSQDLAKNIDKLNDTELSRIARELEASLPDLGEIKPLTDAERRLAELIEELSGLARGDDTAGSIPPAYRRAVEDYYRSLSDDFGDEEAAPR